MTGEGFNTQLTRDAEHYLQQLRRGEFEVAFHNLREIGPDGLPVIVAAFENEVSPDVRSSLLRVISEFRSPAALSVFESALRDSHSQVWRAALDGLVTLGLPAASELLAATIAEESRQPKPDSEFLDWLREAHQQTIEAHE